ncbi:heavy-metal-associated domain-containing protein [Georgenia sp. EYE_87]|jgi:copper chaperone CopZ|uniref:heavy-metal-associated domain-containing protein n=1 Tax=Georgenia sp. EYE_87 TaxID=2853448 RepID=UPI002005CE50|nr:heavy-metal-associated domain-containing protein [Georgenia sp. EYE_87]MCK6211240.1 heavy-metal-associated domain-containing protein [Georgenia sp. EYE_87]
MSTTEIDRTTVVDVEGMTCGHCVQHVTSELEALPAVKNVSIQLNAGGVSPVTVVSDTVLDDAALKAAVDEAGYTVAGIRRDA